MGSSHSHNTRWHAHDGRSSTLLASTDGASAVTSRPAHDRCSGPAGAETISLWRPALQRAIWISLRRAARQAQGGLGEHLHVWHVWRNGAGYRPDHIQARHDRANLGTRRSKEEARGGRRHAQVGEVVDIGVPSAPIVAMYSISKLDGSSVQQQR